MTVALTLSAPKTPYDVLMKSPNLSLRFHCKHIGSISFFILDKLR